MLKMARLESLAALLLAATFFAASSQMLPAQEEEPAKPYLGVIVKPTDDGSSVFIEDIDKEGPATAAGLKPGDVIESINGTAIATTETMGAALKGQVVGATLKFVVKRDGKSITANVKLVAAPAGAPSGGVEVEKKGDAPAAGGPPSPLPDPDSGIPSSPSTPGPARPYLGLTVIANARGGAAISSVRKDSPAARIGFPLGGVIIRVNDTPVENPDDLINFIASLEPGAMVELSYMHNERLYRKSVKLSGIGGAGVPSKVEPELVSPPPAPAPGTTLPKSTAPKSAPAVREERPLINGIGRALNGGLGGGILGGGAAPVGEAAAMQQQLDDLRALVTTMEERIAKLEAELAYLKPAKPEEVPPAPAP